MTSEIENINKEIKQGDIVFTNDDILKDVTKKQEHVDAMTTPTMRRVLDSKKFLEEKNKKLLVEKNQIFKE